MKQPCCKLLFRPLTELPRHFYRSKISGWGRGMQLAWTHIAATSAAPGSGFDPTADYDQMTILKCIFISYRENFMNYVFLYSFGFSILIFEQLTILTNVSGTGFVLFANSAAASPTPRARPDCPGLTKHKKMKFSLWPDFLALAVLGQVGPLAQLATCEQLGPDQPGHTRDIYLSFGNLL